MDILSFIAALVSSLAWPTAVTLIALAFRKEIRALLPFLRKLKAVNRPGFPGGSLL
ncbi:hypothetical protein [Panacagrimonas sp.]|uniref:hypothetical protein n=1 Tax=Panacagrimonas sp. TaxID=2480088 RepID=UPI003B52557C